ncbi:MAG TPA: PilZ domain-containing protein [Thermoanaerobaculia bacterium]|nr:PilZ domain-containing protein [Thermoanaerobaculia bacterium]
MMQFPRTRRVQRIHLAQPVVARLGAASVVLVDISVLGARVEHHMPLAAGNRAHLAFRWDDSDIVADCRVVRSRLERFSVGSDGLTVYHSGLEFENLAGDTRSRLKEMIGCFITRALEEQKLNARGVVPAHQLERMPIFRRGGQLTANSKEMKETVGASALPTSRLIADSGYVCYSLVHNQWKKKRTHDPGQPADGFTISALEDPEQCSLLCDAYVSSDPSGRRLIQLFSQLSIADGEGIAPGRFDP